MSYEYNPKSNVVFGSVDLSDYNAYAVYCNIFDRPERDISVVSVPGRNGDLIFDNGRYKNVDRTYQIHVVGVENVHSLIRDLTSTIGYQRLEDEYDPNVYMMARIKSKPSVKKFVGNAVLLTVTFDRMPQRWDKNEGLSSGKRYFKLKNNSGNLMTDYAVTYAYVKNDGTEITKPYIELVYNYTGGNDDKGRIDIFASTMAPRYFDSDMLYLHYGDFYETTYSVPIYPKCFQLSFPFDSDYPDDAAGIYRIIIDSEKMAVYDRDTNRKLNEYIYDYTEFPEMEPNATMHIYAILETTNMVELQPNIDEVNINARRWNI